eukprot:11279490-Karenia_brevis.AAC.1
MHTSARGDHNMCSHASQESVMAKASPVPFNAVHAEASRKNFNSQVHANMRTYAKDDHNICSHASPVLLDANAA